MLVQRTTSESLVINSLPDGSKVIFDSENERVLALNTTAAAAWDACEASETLSDVTESMQRSFNPATTSEVAEEALLQLQEQNLVKTSGPSGTRREFIATLGAIAVPLVASLTVTEQRAHAVVARSVTPRPTPTPIPRPQ